MAKKNSKTKPPHYDLIVIGSGPAGEKGAAQAAYFGKRVAMIEKADVPGGAGVNTGTLPSKTLRESSLYLSGVRSRGLYGVNYLIKRDITVQDFMYREKYVVKREHERITRNLDRHRIDYIQGRAEFVDPFTIKIHSLMGTRELTADRFLIAVGTTPFQPSSLPFEDPHVYDSDTILKMNTMPTSLCIIGGGVIGCEYATIFAALGIRVILVEGKDILLPFLDHEISVRLHEHMMKLGIQVIFRDSVTSVDRVSETALRVHLHSQEDFDVHSVLFAAGRAANTLGLGLEHIGVETQKRGQIKVNENYQTSIPHIYAAGDVIGFPALASTSMEQGRVAMCHAFGLTYKQRLSNEIPYGIYTIPEVSYVGESEQSCAEKGIAYEVGRASFGANARGQIMGEEDGMIKLVFSPTNARLLGVHIIGERATEIIHAGASVIHFEGALDYFIQAVFNHPTLSEAYKYAAYDGLGRLSRRVQMEGMDSLKKPQAAAK